MENDNDRIYMEEIILSRNNNIFSTANDNPTNKKNFGGVNCSNAKVSGIMCQHSFIGGMGCMNIVGGVGCINIIGGVGCISVAGGVTCKTCF